MRWLTRPFLSVTLRFLNSASRFGAEEGDAETGLNHLTLLAASLRVALVLDEVALGQPVEHVLAVQESEMEEVAAATEVHLLWELLLAAN